MKWFYMIVGIHIASLVFPSSLVRAPWLHTDNISYEGG